MNELELKQFAEDNNMSREDIAKLLDSSVHTVNSWFAGSRNMPLSKLKILQSYNVPIQSMNKATLENRVELLEANVNSLKDRLKMVYDQLLFLQNAFLNEKK